MNDKNDLEIIKHKPYVLVFLFFVLNFNNLVENNFYIFAFFEARKMWIDFDSIVFDLHAFYKKVIHASITRLS